MFTYKMSLNQHPNFLNQSKTIQSLQFNHLQSKFNKSNKSCPINLFKYKTAWRNINQIITNNSQLDNRNQSTKLQKKGKCQLWCLRNIRSSMEKHLMIKLSSKTMSLNHQFNPSHKDVINSRFNLLLNLLKPKSNLI
jgi:hypothetical protein